MKFFYFFIVKYYKFCIGNINTKKVACAALALGAAWYFGVPTAAPQALSTTAAAQAVQTTLIGFGGFAAVNAFGTQKNHGPLSAGVAQSGNIETTQATTVSDEQVKAELQLIFDAYSAKSYVAPKECRYFGHLLQSIDTFKKNPIDECNTEQFLREVERFGIDKIKSPQALAAIYFRLTLEMNHGSKDYQRLNEQMRQKIESSPQGKKCEPYVDQLIARMSKRTTELEKAKKS